LVRVTIFLAGEQVRRGDQGDDVGHCEEAPTRQVGHCEEAADAASWSLRGGAADAAIQFHPLTICRRIGLLTTRKAKPLDCRVGFASSQ
jgi:hypothetical protein